MRNKVGSELLDLSKEEANFADRREAAAPSAAWTEKKKEL